MADPQQIGGGLLILAAIGYAARVNGWKLPRLKPRRAAAVDSPAEFRIKADQLATEFERLHGECMADKAENKRLVQGVTGVVSKARAHTEEVES